MQPTMEIKWKKKKEKHRAEGNSSSIYFCCKELADIYFNSERYDDALNEYHEMKQISLESDCKLDVGRADRMIGEVYCEKGEFDKAIAHQKNHLDISREESDKVEEQRALATLGRTYFLLAESIADGSSDSRAKALNEAKKFYMKSLDICNKLTEENISTRLRMEMTGRLFLNIGLVLDCQNHYDDAINHMLKAVMICKKLDLWEDLYRTYTALGSIYHKHSDKKEALRTYELAVEVAERLDNKIQLVCELLLQKTDVLLDLPDLRGARQALLRAYKLKPSSKSLKMEIEKRLRTVAAMCEFENNLTDLPPENNYAERKRLYENLGDAASELNNYSLALTYYHLMLECVQKCGNKKKDLIESYISLAQSYKDNNQLPNALKYFQEELALEETNSPEACKTLLNIAEIYQLQDNVEEMLATYSIAKSISSESSDLKLKRTVLKSLYYALTTVNKVSEAEEVKRELNDLKLDVLMESSDEEEDNTITFGANICIDDLSDEEAANNISKKTKLSRTRFRHKGIQEKKNEKGETALHVAAINGNASLVKRLIEQGYEVDAKDNSGWTPLHEACNHGHIEVVQVLLDHNAPVNDRGGAHCEGISPLLDAASNGSLDVIDLLLKYGASPVSVNNRGETVLDCLSSWRERRYAELGVDLDPITGAHYDSIYSNLKQILEKAGHKVNNKLQQHSNKMSKEPSTAHRTSTNQLKHVSGEKKELTTDDYQSTMKALRRRSSNEKLISLRTNKTSIPALLAEEETVGDDWLEVDIDMQRPSKKRRTDYLLYDGKNKENVVNKRNRSISFDSDEEKSVVEDLDSINESDMDQWSQRNSEIEDTSLISSQRSDSSSDNQRVRLKEINVKKKQISLLAAGVIKEKVSKTSSSCSINMETSNHSQVSQKSNFTCIKVRIEDKTIVVPIPQSNFESLSISWLAKEAADRYRKLEGSEPLLRLEMDGGLLVGSDPLAIVMGVPQLHAHVLSWKVLSLTEVYKEACENAMVLVDTELNEILEASQATGSAAFDFMYLERKQLTPLFHALSHHIPLQHLSITGTNISDNFVPELADCIAKLQRLRSLDLSNINITSKGLEVICKAVKKHNAFQVLEKLKLGYNPLGDYLRPLAELINLIPHLRYLAIPSVGITSRSFSSFIQFTLEHLEVLDISFNEIGQSLTDILSRLEAETIIDLRLSNTGSHTIREIGFYLQHYTPLSLRSLDLSFCPTTQIELDCLIKGVNMCKHLERLLLDGIGEITINIDDLSIKELSICGTKFIGGTILSDKLKTLTLTESDQVCYPLNKGPFGLGRITN